MKLKVSSNPVHVVGGERRTSVSIAANGKAFKALTDNLYQNKIGSIVREISANAIDAQNQAGNGEIPFQIHLPDTFEPWFSVRDFGIGLSPEIMKNVFLTLFESTKDQSNDSIGAFGLGSKTPLAYTDQFTITSVIDGTARLYSIFIENTGDLQCVEMGEFDTDEPNGVEVKLGVRPEDYNSFKNEVVNQLSFYKIRPEIVNGTVVWKELGEAIYKSDDAFISADAVGYGQDGITIIQGGVGYPVNVSNLRGKISDTNSSFLESIAYNFLYLYFDIGEIGVTISREAIEYSPDTIKNIESKLDALRENIAKFVADMLNNCVNDWERAVYAASSPLVVRLMHAAGIKINNLNMSYGRAFYDVSNVFFDRIKQSCTARIKTVRMSRKSDTVTSIGPKSDLVVYVQDTKYRPLARLEWHYQNVCSTTNALYLTVRNIANVNEVKETLSKYLGGFDNFVMLSEIEIPKNVKAQDSYTRPTYYHNAHMSGGDTISNWNKCYDDITEIEDDVAYVIVKGLNIISGSTFNDGNIEYVCNDVLRNYGVSNHVFLIGIREADVPKIADKENFKFFPDVVKEIHLEKMEELKSYRHAIRQISMSNAVSGSVVGNKMFIKHFNKIDDNNHVIHRLQAIMDRCGDVGTNLPKYVQSAFSSKIYDLSKRYTAKINSCLNARYPLLKLANSYHVNDSFYPEFIEYINLVDKARAA